jgi:hypothetical protein
MRYGNAAIHAEHVAWAFGVRVSVSGSRRRFNAPSILLTLGSGEPDAGADQEPKGKEARQLRPHRMWLVPFVHVRGLGSLVSVSVSLFLGVLLH